jgi:2-haloacid dehalogenase
MEKGMDANKPAVIFDIGGVLLDWNPRYLYRKIFLDDETRVEDFLNRVCTLDWNLSIDAGKPYPEAIAERIALFPDQAEAIRAYYERWDEMLGEPLTGMVQLLESIAGTGYPLYALTNFALEKFTYTRARYPFLDIFQEIVVSSVIKVAKPDPRIFLYLLDRIKRQAGECIFIDDNAANIHSARRLGFRSIQFQTAMHLQADLAREGITLTVPEQ